MARRGRAAPAARLRPRRREPLAEPHRRRGDRPARPAARRPRSARAAPTLLERFELDPTKKGRTYSKGNRQKVALVAALAVRRRAADPRRADLRASTRSWRRSSARASRSVAQRARPCCCRATSSPRSRRSCDRVTHHPRRARPSRPARSPSLRHLTRTSIDAETERPPDRARRAPRRPRPPRRGHRRALRRRHEPPRRGAAPADAARRAQRSTSRPPTLEELFLRHYGDDLDGAASDGAGATRRRSARADRDARARPGCGATASGSSPASSRSSSSSLASSSSLKSLYPTARRPREGRGDARPTTRRSIALRGPARGLDTLGGLIAFQLGANGAVVASRS